MPTNIESLRPAPPISDRIRIDADLIRNRQVLCCPQCNDGYLAHVAVTVYDRHEDAEYTTETKIRCSDPFFKESHSRTVVETERSSESRNPSERRHGLAILFLCEICGETSELTVAQHKGHTYMAWRAALEPVEAT